MEKIEELQQQPCISDNQASINKGGMTKRIKRGKDYKMTNRKKECLERMEGGEIVRMRNRNKV